MAYAVRFGARHVSSIDRPRLFVLFSSACGNGSSPNSASQSSDAGAASVDCVGVSATTDTSCGSLGWSQSSTDSRPRNHHLSVIARTSSGAFLYSVAGADNGSPIANVDRAPINEDGSTTSSRRT